MLNRLTTSFLWLATRYDTTMAAERMQQLLTNEQMTALVNKVLELQRSKARA
jgi:hypothetical protein